MRTGMTEVQVLREVVKKVVPMITGRGVRVTQLGAQAFVAHDPRTGKITQVNIPHIPDDADSRLVLAIQGFIDHECGHVLDTDWAAVGDAKRVGRDIADDQKIDRGLAIGRLESLANIVEDPYVERCMQKRFPGAAYNLDRLYDVFIERLTKPALDKETEQANRLRILLVPIVRSIAGQKAFTEFLDKGGYWDEPLVKALMDRITPALHKEIATVKNSWDSLDVATQLYHILHPAPPPPPPPPPPPAPKSKPSESEPSKSKPSEDSKCSAAPSGDAEESEEEGEGAESPDAGSDAAETEEPEDEAAPDAPDGSEPPDTDGGAEEKSDSAADDLDAEDEEVDSGDADPSPEEAPAEPTEETDVEDDAELGGGSASDEDEDEKSKPEVDAGSATEPPDETTEAESEPAEATPTETEEEPDSSAAPEMSPFSETDIKAPKSMAEAIAEMITDEATAETRGADYRVYTKDWDVIEPIDIEGVQPEWLERLDDVTRHMVAPMQKDIERMMASRSQVVKVPGFRSGKLHAGSLHRLRVNDDRVFRRTQENNSKATAVSLVVDDSGSMSGVKHQTAMAAAYALSQTLERVGIRHEVIGFTTRDTTRAQDAELHAEASRIGVSYTRAEPLYMPIYKGYDERLNTEVRKRFAKGFGYADYLSQNVDGECVQIAANRLLQQREPRKVMIVLSDGNPSCGSPYIRELCSDLHRVVQHVRKVGIEIIGIGIMTDVVKRFYPKHIVLNNVADLPKTVMGELKRILVSGDR
jgi:hypothetical protein